MKIVHQYVGPNSYDVRREASVITVKVGCFESGIPIDARIGFYGELLSELNDPQRQLIVQIQSHWFQRFQDKRRARALGSIHKGDGWIAVGCRTRQAVGKTIQEFWRDKELRFYSVPASSNFNDLPLERWYRSYLEDFREGDLASLHFIADEVWCEGYLALRSAALSEEAVLNAISKVAEANQLHFVFNREPFLGAVKGASERKLDSGRL